MKSKRAKKDDPWLKLTRLIRRYRDASVAKSWKGALDPTDHEAIDLRTQLARVELSVHIAKMKRELT